MASSTMAFASASLETAACTNRASPPARWIPSAAASPAWSATSVRITFAPSSANSLDATMPMPLAPPVMSATFPLSRPIRLPPPSDSGPKHPHPSWVAGESREPPERGESLRRAGPVPADRVGAGTPDDRTQHRGDDDDVVGVADHRDEVGNQVEREGQVGEQEPEPDAYPPVERAVGRESPEQSHGVRKQADRLLQRALGRSTNPDDHDEHEPRGQHRAPDRDEDPDQRGHRKPASCIGPPCISSAQKPRRSRSHDRAVDAGRGARRRRRGEDLPGDRARNGRPDGRGGRRREGGRREGGPDRPPSVRGGTVAKDERPGGGGGPPEGFFPDPRAGGGARPAGGEDRRKADLGCAWRDRHR